MYALQFVKERKGGYSALKPEGIQSTKSPGDNTQTTKRMEE